MDEHGYPDEGELRDIENWPHTDHLGLMRFVQRLWRYPDRWHEEPVYGSLREGREGVEYRVSTGGWSGNESLIYALERNTLFWALCWQLSQRGGYYEFRVWHDTEEGE